MTQGGRRGMTKSCCRAAQRLLVTTALPWGLLAAGVTFAHAGTFTVGLAAAPVTGRIPEPSTWAMMLIGFAGLGLAGYHGARNRRQEPAAKAPGWFLP